MSKKRAKKDFYTKENIDAAIKEYETSGKIMADVAEEYGINATLLLHYYLKSKKERIGYESE